MPFQDLVQSPKGQEKLNEDGWRYLLDLLSVLSILCVCGWAFGTQSNLSDWSMYFSEWFFTFSPALPPVNTSFHFCHTISLDSLTVFKTVVHAIIPFIKYYTNTYKYYTLWEIHTFMVSIQGKTSWEENKQIISYFQDGTKVSHACDWF